MDKFHTNVAMNNANVDGMQKGQVKFYEKEFIE